MAFRQPAFAPARAVAPQNTPQQTFEPTSYHSQSQAEASQEWVLFPSRRSETSAAYTASSPTERSGQTVGLSRASDLISFDSAIRAGRLSEEALEEHELDSLDDNLPAFREPRIYRTTSQPLDQNTGTVLPAHDGLGTFPSSNVQEQIWQHEQYNPKRKFEGHHRRRSSIQRRLDTVEETESNTFDEEKRLRIENWRLDQSKALLDEIERETRKRIRREALSSSDTRSGNAISQQNPGDSLLGSTPTQQDIHGLRDLNDDEGEPFWTRLTRRFIKDVMGIDESLLSVLFGESLPDEVLQIRPSSPLSTIPEQAIPSSSQLSTTETGWRDRLLQRIAKELGVFVHQLSSHPGAFSTYLPATTNMKEDKAFLNKSDPSHAASWGMEDDGPQDSTLKAQNGPGQGQQCDKSYWERDLDINMAFQFLKDRFSRAKPSQAPIQPHIPSLQDSVRRAAIIRQHHPLVARAHQHSIMRSRRESSYHSLRRPASSCASQSIRSSKRGSLVRSSSSRNYWDIGGSLGSGSAIASGGMMGAWGEA